MFCCEGFRVCTYQHLYILHIFALFERYGYFPLAKNLVAHFKHHFLMRSWSLLRGVRFQYLSKYGVHINTFQVLGGHHIIFHLHTKYLGPVFLSFKIWLIWGRGFLSSPYLLELWSLSFPCVSYLLGLDVSLGFAPWYISLYLSSPLWYFFLNFGYRRYRSAFQRHLHLLTPQYHHQHYLWYLMYSLHHLVPSITQLTFHLICFILWSIFLPPQT